MIGDNYQDRKLLKDLYTNCLNKKEIESTKVLKGLLIKSISKIMDTENMENESEMNLSNQ